MTGIQALLQEAVKAKQTVEEAENRQKLAQRSLEESECNRKGDMTSVLQIKIM